MSQNSWVLQMDPRNSQKHQFLALESLDQRIDQGQTLPLGQEGAELGHRLAMFFPPKKNLSMDIYGTM